MSIREIRNSMMSRIPSRGEVVRRGMPDTQESIEFEISRMVQFVRQGVGDELVIQTARRITSQCPAKDIDCEIESIFIWGKSNFRFQQDPVDKEVIETAQKMLRDLKMPKAVLVKVLGPDLVSAVLGFGNTSVKGIQSKISEDCDGAAVLMASLLGAVGIKSRFRFGGKKSGAKGCQIFHVWVQAQADGGGWKDLDITEEESSVGWVWPGFGCFQLTEIF